MKTILYTILLCIFVIPSVCAMNPDSLYTIKGYYITQYNKSEVVHFYTQKLNKLNGESYSTAIDKNTVSYFVPIQIGNKMILEEDITSEQIERYMNKIFNKKIDVSTEICLFQEANKVSPYYLPNNNDNRLYKCMYLEGKVLINSIINSEDNRFGIRLSIDAVNKISPEIHLFFVVKITRYTPIVNIEGLSLWFPYINNI